MKKMKLCAFACALAVGLSLTGCSDTSWILKDGDITIPTGIYNYYLISGASEVSSLAASSSSSGTSSADIWSQTVSGTDAVTWTKNNALESCKKLAVIEKLCAQRNVTLTKDQESTASSNASTSYSAYKTLWSNNDISETSLQRLVKDLYLKQKLFDSYYGKNGDKAVSESEIENYYTENFAHVKQIFISKYDTTNYTALSGDNLKAAEKKAKEAYEAAKADPKNFDKYVEKYNEDPGMKSDPNGYIFSKKTAASDGFDTKFTDLAFSLKVGDVGMAKSDMGWFIEYRVDTDPKDSDTFTDSMKSTVLSEMKIDEFEKLITDQVAKESFQLNDSTISHYNPKKLNLSTSK